MPAFWRDANVCLSKCIGSVFNQAMKTALACLHVCPGWLWLFCLQCSNIGHCVVLQAWSLLWATPDSSNFCHACHIVTSPATDWSWPQSLRSLYTKCLRFCWRIGCRVWYTLWNLYVRIWLTPCWGADPRINFGMHVLLYVKYSEVPSVVFTRIAIAYACFCLFATRPKRSILPSCDQVYYTSCNWGVYSALRFPSCKIGNATLEMSTFNRLAVKQALNSVVSLNCKPAHEVLQLHQ